MVERIQAFDPQQEYAVVQRRLPHWSQAGTVAFLTWRTWDSIPKHVLQTWLAERAIWLRDHGINPADIHWQLQLQQLGPQLLQAFQRRFSDRWHVHLDACHGACVLRKPAFSQIVADSLLHFAGQRYDLTDFVIMPNHVHVLTAFPDEELMLRQCDSWKHFTATRINRELNRQGRFWQPDGFDHLVRSVEQFEYLRRYIADNPHRAGLQPREFRHFTAP